VNGIISGLLHAGIESQDQQQEEKEEEEEDKNQIDGEKRLCQK
jgi:hypothetical protein